MTLLDHLLAIVLVVIGPLRSGTVGLRRFKVAAPQDLPRVRLRAYRVAMSMQWLRVLATAAIWWFTGRSLSDLGLELRLGGGMIGVALGLAIITPIMVDQRRRAITDPDTLAEVRHRLEPVKFLVPHTRSEFRPFVWVSITAGVCEELLYRGYLIWYFSHALPWWAAALVSALAFGIGHAYQGTRGVVITTLLGAFLAAVYFVTGSLYASMLIHALMDAHTGDLAWRAYEAERQAAESLGEPEDSGVAGEVESAPPSGAPVETDHAS